MDVPGDQVLPNKEQSPHYNFPDVFTVAGTEHLLVRLQTQLSDRNHPRDIVLNFEKCRWFEPLAVARLLAVASQPHEGNLTFHVVGPCVEVLPYLYE